jgi:DNA-binding Xre family transcriptional regulator
VSDKTRIIELQKSLKIAREALERIHYGTTRAEAIATEALEKLWKLEPKQQLQGIVGHSARRS